MFHHIQFNESVKVDLEVSSKQPLERLCIGKGARFRAQLRPHVIDTPNGPVEAADLFFADGTAVRGVPFERFRFVD
jgi:hypothetical protein